MRTVFLKRLCWVGIGCLIFGLVLRPSRGQDWFSTGINLGAAKIRLAVSPFQPVTSDPALSKLTTEFNQVLWNDLDESGIVDLVSKSNYPLRLPRDPEEVDFKAWTDPPAAAHMLAFGKTEVLNGNLVPTARLYDVGNTGNPSVLAKRYVTAPNEVSARAAAHRFANEIIQALGGGIPGIALSRIAFVSSRTSHSEIWVMDYDGYDQRPITNFGSLSLTPRWSPDDTRIAYTSYLRGNPDIYVFSLETYRGVPFPRFRGLNTTPAWSPDGRHLVFESNRSGSKQVWTMLADGSNPRQLTTKGENWNPSWSN